MMDLFDTLEPARREIAAGAMLLKGFALSFEAALIPALEAALLAAPLRRMMTPGGFEMSVAMSNCGAAGWVSDRTGYRYAATDPLSGKAWPAMPDVFCRLAMAAAVECGSGEFKPDVCLINCYEPGARLSLHQDRDEKDFGHPIVSVSLGLPATFQFGGLKRSDPVLKLPLLHGEVVVWGGPARLAYHGVLALKDGVHPAMGRRRVNLTFRRAL
jgi:DNA oxidative demethylase